ncbi:MAG TPA: glycine cleavage system protein H [Candidatus Aquilonibacter sp.]|nr:glycine cleavage system protein H [Candidatus Aquilonibacter sp.]
MSILFVLLTYIVIIAVNYYIRTPQPAPPELRAAIPRPQAPVMIKEFGFSVPQDYRFHPGHTWAMREGRENVRVGLDSFATELAGKIDRIEVVQPSRWVRQGQRLMTITADGTTFDLLSPVEGVVMAVNDDVVKNPSLAESDPYKDGWIAMLKSWDFLMNEKNLLQGSMVAPWMHYNVARLNKSLETVNPGLAQDGGVPLKGLLLKVNPELRRRLIKEFFLN